MLVRADTTRAPSDIAFKVVHPNLYIATEVPVKTPNLEVWTMGSSLNLEFRPGPGRARRQ